MQGTPTRADSKKSTKRAVGGSYSNIWSAGIPGSVDTEDVSSYSSVSEVYDMNYQRPGQSLLSRQLRQALDAAAKPPSASRTSNTEILQQLQQLHSLQMTREASSNTLDRPDVQVLPEPRPLRRKSRPCGRTHGGSLKLSPRTVMGHQGEQGSGILGDLGIIPRSRRKSDFAVPHSATVSGETSGRAPDVSVPVVQGWLPLPSKTDTFKDGRWKGDHHLDRVSENSVSQMSSAVSSPRRSSKILRAEVVEHADKDAPKSDEDQDAPPEGGRAGTKEAPPDPEELLHAPTLTQHVRFPIGRSRRNSDAAGSVASFFSTPYWRTKDDFDYEFELLSCWNRTAKHSAKVTKFHRLVTRSSLSKHFSDFPEELQDGQAIFVIKPFSAKKITWDLLICCIVLHDGIVLPLQLLGIEVSTSDMLAWPLTLAWTVDLVVSSIITFERNDGTWETRVRYTFRRYFAGSFLPDFVLAALAWVERFTFSQRLGATFLRICRLFRLYRIEAIIQLVSNNIRSERAVLCIGISGKIMWLAVFLHFIACLWLSLGRQEGGWVSYHKPGIADIQQYSIAFHWTLAQFHGSMELYPVTVEERIFAFCYLLMAYILAVVFISSMTSAMTRLYLITGIQAGHQRVLRKASLTAQSHAVPETEVEFLQLVLCHTAISLALVSHGDLVFIQGEVPVEPRMVFITDGDLVYFRSGKFESMSVLWTDWLHHGTLRVASMRVRLLLLSAKTFQELAQKNACPEIETCTQGSIMRLGPVPVAYHLVPAQALEVAGWQSLATHPGAEAALCCRFIASFCVAAIASHRDAAKASDAELTVLDPIGDTRAFLENHINAFLQQSDSMALPKKLDQDGSCARRLQQLLMSQAPSRKEAHWNWKVAKLPIADSIAARQGIAGVDLYNGHPTIATYFGAYCMDGLAMALWALWSSNSYSSAVRAGVNLLGDADTVGAIVGQMAGSLYGWKQIKSEAFSERCVRNLKYWDKCAEIGLRAALLYHLGPRPRGSLKPVEGESKAKLYQRPSGDVPLAGELPAGEWVTCVDAAKDFFCVSHEGSGLQGWVPKKSIADWAPAAGTEELSLFVVSGTEAPKSPALPRRDAQPRGLLCAISSCPSWYPPVGREKR
eukprot:s4820_g4.t1